MTYPTKRIKELERENAKLKARIADMEKKVDKHRADPRHKIVRYQLTEYQIKKVLVELGFLPSDDNVEHIAQMFQNKYTGYVKEMDDYAEKLIREKIERVHYQLEKNPERAFTEAVKGT